MVCYRNEGNTFRHRSALTRSARALSVQILAMALVATACGSADSSDSAGNGGIESRARDVDTTASIAAQTTPSTVERGTTSQPESSATADSNSGETSAAETSAPVVETGSGVLVSDGFAGFEGKRVGVIVNQTSMIGDVHLADAVNNATKVELAAIFSPEHGVRGAADAGELIEDSVDTATGATIFSLYGATREPTPAMLAGIDVLFYDLQDVGARHYTYISTMGLAMQAAAKANIPFVVLDRPNPLGGDRIEGPVLELSLKSFIGQYPIPSVYGLTAGELALAIKGEQWLAGLADLDLRVVQMRGWRRSMQWEETGLPWIPPSPGLPTAESALVYPGTVLIEATPLSYGNGTMMPFTTVGAAWINGVELATTLNDLGLAGVTFLATEYTPMPIPRIAPTPRLEGQLLSGVVIEVTDEAAFSPYRTGLEVFAALQAQAYAEGVGAIVDRGAVFDLLTGSSTLRAGLAAGQDLELLSSTLVQGQEEFASLVSDYYLY